MTQRKYSTPLAKSQMPMLSSQVGRTVMVPHGSTGSDQRTPGILYMENVMPTEEGLSSVYLVSRIAAIVGASNFRATKRISSTLGVTYALGLEKNVNDAYTKVASTSASWTTHAATFTNASPHEDVTVGTVNGVSYIFEDSVGCSTFDGTNFAAAVLAGLTVANITGVVASSGYLIAYDETDVSWSSTVDPTDFVPSTVTGAGGGSVAEIKGFIRFCLPLPTGFLIYADHNVIAATYTGNAKYPFKFKEVSGAGGGLTINEVAYDHNSAIHYAITEFGIQAINQVKAEIILPNMVKLSKLSKYESFSAVTKQITSNTYSSPMSTVALIENRYLVVSTKATASAYYSYATIYDIALGRIGKVATQHTHVTSVITLSSIAEELGIGFVAPTGEVSGLRFSTSAGSADSVLILGKYQATASKFINLQEVELEDINSSETLTVSVNVSLDGKSIASTKTAAQLASAAGIKRYGVTASGMNHSIVIEGDFQLSEAMITYNLTGKMNLI